jgi:hypothetical protein
MQDKNGRPPAAAFTPIAAALNCVKLTLAAAARKMRSLVAVSGV